MRRRYRPAGQIASFNRVALFRTKFSRKYVDKSNTMDLVDGFTLTLLASKISIDSSCDLFANCPEDGLRDCWEKEDET